MNILFPITRGHAFGLRFRKRHWLLGFVCVWLLTAGAVPAGGDDIRLNEIMANPASDWDGDGVYQFRDDEWVEIINVGVAPVSLTGYRLANADTIWRYEFSGTLDPGQMKVVYGSQSYAWEKATGNPAFGLRLANTGSEIALWKIAGGTPQFLESYAYLDHEAEDNRSSGRFPDGTDTWHIFDALNPYSGGTAPFGTGCDPSPGTAAICLVPIEPSTWGRLKTLYGR